MLQFRTSSDSVVTASASGCAIAQLPRRLWERAALISHGPVPHAESARLGKLGFPVAVEGFEHQRYPTIMPCEVSFVDPGLVTRAAHVLSIGTDASCSVIVLVPTNHARRVASQAPPRSLGASRVPAYEVTGHPWSGLCRCKPHDLVACPPFHRKAVQRLRSGENTSWRSL